MVNFTLINLQLITKVKDRIFMLIFSINMLLMPIKIEYTNVTVILLIIVWLWSGDYKYIPEVLKKESRISLLISLLFFVTLLTAVIFFDEKDFKEMEKTLVFLFFPLIISTTKSLNKERIVFLIKIFGYGLTSICFYALIKILLVYLKFNWLPNLGEGPWVDEYILMHRPYFGMYSSFAIVSFIYFIENKLSNKIFGVVVIVTNIWIIFFITSKLAILFLMFYFLYKAFNVAVNQKLFFKGTSFILLFLTPLFFMYKNNTDAFFDRIYSPLKNQDRLKTWACTLEVLQSDKYNFIVGFFSESKFQNELNELLKKKNFRILNTHNQYLDYLGAYGLIGLMLFLYVLKKLFQIAIKHKNILFVNFLILICFQCLTENIFSRQWGIFFVAVFTSLFIRQIKHLDLNE